jgi:hypothetical protein
MLILATIIAGVVAGGPSGGRGELIGKAICRFAGTYIDAVTCGNERNMMVLGYAAIGLVVLVVMFWQVAKFRSR